MHDSWGWCIASKCNGENFSQWMLHIILDRYTSKTSCYVTCVSCRTHTDSYRILFKYYVILLTDRWSLLATSQDSRFTAFRYPSQISASATIALQISTKIYPVILWENLRVQLQSAIFSNFVVSPLDVNTLIFQLCANYAWLCHTATFEMVICALVIFACDRNVKGFCAK